MTRRKTTRPAHAALLLLFALVWGAAFTLTAEAAPEKIFYGFDREFPPYSFEIDGKPAGFDVELLQAALEGYDEIQLVPKPLQWEEVQLELSAGDIQLTSGMTKTPQRSMLYHFSERPTLPLRIKLFTKNAKRVGNLEQLRGRTVATEKGSLYQRVLEQFGGLNIKLYDSDLEAVKALRADQVAAYGGADRTTYYYLDKLGYTNISAVGTPLAITNMYFAVNRDRTDLLEKINTGLQRVWESGEYHTIFRRWFVPELVREEQDAMISEAVKAAAAAYAPYSGQPMGASVLTWSGNIYVGCTVENGETSLSQSALSVALHNAVTNAEQEIRAAVLVHADGRIAWLPAADRRRLYEFGRGVLVVTEPASGRRVVQMISDLLPFPFSPDAEIYQTY